MGRFARKRHLKETVNTQGLARKKGGKKNGWARWR